MVFSTLQVFKTGHSPGRVSARVSAVGSRLVERFDQQRHHLNMEGSGQKFRPSFRMFWPPPFDLDPRCQGNVVNAGPPKKLSDVQIGLPSATLKGCRVRIAAIDWRRSLTSPNVSLMRPAETAWLTLSSILFVTHTYIIYLYLSLSLSHVWFSLGLHLDLLARWLLIPMNCLEGDTVRRHLWK